MIADNAAVTFTGLDAVEIRNIDRPTPKQGEVLIETVCSLISTGTECIVLQRKFEEGTNWHAWVKYPFHPGYCGVGRVLAIGPDTQAACKVGDRVSAWSQHMRYAVGPAARAIVVPDDVSDDEAAWAPMAQIALHGFRKARLELGETVIVVGLGMLGQLIVQYARNAGAAKIIAIDPAQPRLTMAQAHGATHTLAMSVEAAAEPVKEITGGAMAQVLFDMTGFAPVFAASHQLLADFGRLILIGDCGTPSKQHLTSQVMLKNLEIHGAHQRCAAFAPNWNHLKMGRTFMEYVASRRMDVKSLITHRFAMADAAEAYRLLTSRRDEAMGVVLRFQHSCSLRQSIAE